jgi:iron complex outermembrane receptor protein
MRHDISLAFSSCIQASLVSALALLSTIGPTAMAQDAGVPATPPPANAGLETIIVTATKTGATAVQNTPLAVTAFSASQLEHSNIAGTQDLAKFAPNLQIAQNNEFAEFYIRGVGSNNIFNGSDPDVTVNVDGVYIGRPFGQFTNFLDVDRVEVLRGPQGTLYGRNAVGGTVNVISKVPTDDTEEKFRLSLGDYAKVGVDGYASGAILPGKVDFSVAASYLRHDAYVDNIVSNQPDINNANQGSARLQLRLRPTEDIDATTRVDFALADEADLGTSMLLLPFDKTTNSILGDYHKVAINGPVQDLTRTGGIAEDVTYSLPGSMKLKSITAYRFDDYHLRSATDASDLGYQITELEEKAHQFSQELTLNGTLGRLDYVGGLYYFNEEDRSTSSVRSTKTNTFTEFNPVTNDSAYAGYINANYHLTDDLTLIAGDRYTVEDKDIHQIGGVFSLLTGLNKDLPGAGYRPGGPSTYGLASRNYASTPKAGLQYQVDEDVMTYFTATRGFKSGGFNMTLLPTNAKTELVGFAPEKLWSYELGAKTQWFDNRLRFNVTGFYYDYTNLQVQAFLVPGQTSITNAATATIKGLEFETAAKPIKALDLGFNLSLLDARYSKYPAAPSTGMATIDATGHYLNEAPPLSLNTWAQYDWDLPGDHRLSLRGEYSWQDREYFTVVNDNIQTQKAYGIANLIATWSPPDSNWSVALYTKNLFDQQYITQTGTSGAVAAGHAGDPRTFGATLSWEL